MNPTAVEMIPIAKIAPDPDNERGDVGDVTELAASIKEVGLLEAITVRPNGKGYVVVFGHRRLAGVKAAGLQLVPAIVRDDLTAEQRTIARLVENLHRADLSPLQEAAGFQKLLELGLSQHQVADRVGRSQAHVSKRLALLNLAPSVATMVAKGKLPVEAAVELAKVAPIFQERAIKAVTKSYGSLENAAPYQIRNLGERARDEVKKDARAQKRRALQKQLKDAGVTILSYRDNYSWGEPGHSYRVGGKGSRYERGERIDMTPKAHAKFDCHAAAIYTPSSAYDSQDPYVIYLCTNPGAHMDKKAAAEFAKKSQRAQRDPYAERQRKEKERRAQLEAAAGPRDAMAARALSKPDKAALRMALEMVVVAGIGGDVSPLRILDLLSVKRPKGDGGVSVHDPVFGKLLSKYANESEANLIRAAAATAYLQSQEAMSRQQFWGAFTNRYLVGLEWLQTIGYELTAAERGLLKEARINVGVGAAIPAESDDEEGAAGEPASQPSPASDKAASSSDDEVQLDPLPDGAELLPPGGDTEKVGEPTEQPPVEVVRFQTELASAQPTCPICKQTSCAHTLEDKAAAARRLLEQAELDREPLRQPPPAKAGTCRECGCHGNCESGCVWVDVDEALGLLCSSHQVAVPA